MENKQIKKTVFVPLASLDIGYEYMRALSEVLERFAPPFYETSTINEIDYISEQLNHI